MAALQSPWAALTAASLALWTSDADPPVPGVDAVPSSQATGCWQSWPKPSPMELQLTQGLGRSLKLETSKANGALQDLVHQQYQAATVPRDPPAQQPAQRCHLHKRPSAGCLRCARFRDLTGRSKHQGHGPQALGKDSLEPSEGAELEEPVVGFNALMRSHILKSEYYHVIHRSVRSVDALMEEVQSSAEHAEPYTQHSNTDPSTVFCCIYRLAQLQPSKDQMHQILSFKGSPLVRAVGLLHLRFNFPPWDAWRCLRNFLFDTEPIRLSGQSSVLTPIGEWVETLLTNDKYYDTLLPRLPVSLKRHMALELVQLPQLRQACSKRGRRNEQRALPVGARVQVLHGAKWCGAEVLNSSAVGRSVVLDVQLEDGKVEELPMGLVRQLPRPGTATSRSRSPPAGSPEAKMRCDEYLRRDRDKALAENRNYFKPVPRLKRMMTTYEKSLPLRTAPDMLGPSAKQPAPAKEEETLSLPASADAERRQLFMQVVQKYNAAGSRDAVDRLAYHKWNQQQAAVDVLVPDTLRLG